MHPTLFTSLKCVLSPQGVATPFTIFEEIKLVVLLAIIMDHKYYYLSPNTTDFIDEKGSIMPDSCEKTTLNCTQYQL